MSSFWDCWSRGRVVRGWFDDGDAQLLWSCCVLAKEKASGRTPKFVEVGSFAGRSATLLMGHEADVLLVEPFYLDPDRQPGDDGTAEVDNLYIKRKKCSSLELELKKNLEGFEYILMDWESADAAKTISAQVDLIHLDGDHSEEGVGLDARLWLPKLPQGGLALFHDYGDAAFPAVSRTVDSLLANPLDWSALDRHESLIALERL